IQAPYGQPFAIANRRQTLEYRITPFGVIMRNNFARWFVIQNHPWRPLGVGATNQLSIDPHLVILTDTLANMGWLTIDGHPPSDNELFHFSRSGERRVGKE